METEKKKELRFCHKEKKEHSVVLVDLLNDKDDNDNSSNRSKKLPCALTTETVDTEEEFLSCSEEEDDNNGVMENNLKKNGGHNGECSNNARSSILSKILDLLMTNSRGSATRNNDRGKKSGVFQQIQDLMKREGEHFRSSFLENDHHYNKNMHDLKTARLLFHCCSFIPMLLYYNKGTTHDHPPKFPASISYTIRRGIPHRVQMMLWLWGWSYMGRIIRRTTTTTRDRIVNSNHDDNQTVTAQTMPTTTIWLPKFVMKMVGTGIWTTILFPLGEGTHSLRETAHFLGALVYMIDHIVLFKILNVKTIYQKAFGLSFLLLTISVYGTRTIERLFGLPTESETANATMKKKQQQATNHRNNNKTAINTTKTLERQKQLVVLSPFVRKMFFYLELLLMISENLLFTTFVQGMPSGIEEEYHNIKHKKNQQEEEDNKIDNEEEEERQPQQQKTSQR